MPHIVYAFVRLFRVHNTIIVPPANLEVQAGMFFALQSHRTCAVLFVQRFHLLVAKESALKTHLSLEFK